MITNGPLPLPPPANEKKFSILLGICFRSAKYLSKKFS